MKNKLLKKLSIMVVCSAMVGTFAVGCGPKVPQVPEIPESTTAPATTDGTNEAGAETEEAKNVITVEYQFFSESEKNIKFDIPDTYEQGGKTYKANGNVEYTTSEILECVEKTEEVSVLDKGDIKDTYTYTTANGKKIELKVQDDIDWGELQEIEYPVTETVTYGSRFEKPDIPDEKPIKYHNNRTGEDAVVTGYLADQGKNGPKWKTGYTADGAFVADDNSVCEWDVENFGKVTVSQYAEAPVWDNYQNDVLTIAGLDPKYFRCTGAKWTTDNYKDANGRALRNAQYDIEAYVTDYWAKYENITKVMGYKTTVVYYKLLSDLSKGQRNELGKEDIKKLYKITATVEFEEVE